MNGPDVYVAVGFRLEEAHNNANMAELPTGNTLRANYSGNYILGEKQDGELSRKQQQEPWVWEPRQ